MKFLLKYLEINKKETQQSEKSPVYTFFAEADAEEKTKAYKKALKSASKDQIEILTRYDKEFAHTN